MIDFNKETTRNILSVVIGVLTSVVLFLIGGLILLLLIASKAKGHGEESDLGNITLAGVILLFVCCFAGGFITGKISTKSDWIHGIIAGIVLIILFLAMSEFVVDKESLISTFAIIPFTLAGTYIAILQKRKTFNN